MQILSELHCSVPTCRTEQVQPIYIKCLWRLMSHANCGCLQYCYSTPQLKRFSALVLDSYQHVFNTKHQNICISTTDRIRTKSQRVTLFFFALSCGQFDCAIERLEFYLVFVFTLYIDKSHIYRIMFLKIRRRGRTLGRLSNPCWFKVDSPLQQQKSVCLL